MNLGAWFEAVGLSVRNVYGQTELTGATSITARRGAALESVGRPVRGVEVRVSDKHELLVRSRSAFTRYVGDESATARALVDGWLHSGDRAELRETGDSSCAVGSSRRSSRQTAQRSTRHRWLRD